MLQLFGHCCYQSCPPEAPEHMKILHLLKSMIGLKNTSNLSFGSQSMSAVSRVFILSLYSHNGDFNVVFAADVLSQPQITHCRCTWLYKCPHWTLNLKGSNAETHHLALVLFKEEKKELRRFSILDDLRLFVSIHSWLNSMKGTNVACSPTDG